jgi:hypothetical protein
MNAAQKIAAVAHILDSDLPAEQKLAEIREVLRIGPIQARSSGIHTWNPDDDPEIRRGTPRPHLDAARLSWRHHKE